jgi:hypothetical protein
LSREKVDRQRFLNPSLLNDFFRFDINLNNKTLRLYGSAAQSPGVANSVHGVMTGRNACSCRVLTGGVRSLLQSTASRRPNPHFHLSSASSKLSKRLYSVSATAEAESSHSSSSSSPSPATNISTSSPPRWSQTPPRMVINRPFRLSLKEPQPFAVNEDPEKLDQFYDKLLGENGRLLLDEETKWLAVTNRTFDHGRRGYNDRLAYLGRSSYKT